MEKTGVLLIAALVVTFISALREIPEAAKGPVQKRFGRMFPGHVSSLKRYTTTYCSDQGKDCSSTRYCCHGLACKYERFIPLAGTCVPSSKNL